MQSAIKYQRVYQQSGGTSQTIASGTTESIFEIRNDGFYFDKSYLQFTATVAALAANHASIIYTGLINQVSRVVVYTPSKTICDIQDQNWLSAMLLRAGTSLEDFYTFPGGDQSGRGTIKPLVPMGSSADVDTKKAPFTTDLAAAYNAYRKLGATVNDIGLFEPYDGALDVLMSADATAQIFNFRIPLGMFYETLLASDVLQNFNETVYIKFVWAGRDAWAYDMTDNVSLYPGTAAQAVLGANIALTNLALNVAVEKNDTLIAEAKAAINSPSGRDVYFTSNRQIILQAGGNGNATHSVQAKMSAVDGLTLKRVLLAPFSTTESLRSNFDNSNLTILTAAGGRRITSYYTSLNMARMQNTDLVCADWEDHEITYPYLKGSMLKNAECFYYHWFVLNDFTGKDKPLHKAVKDNADISGLPLTSEVSWAFTAAVPNGINDNNYRAFGVFSRKLNVSAAGGVQVV